MTASSFLIPAAGLITAPILARALDVDGRGEMAAALAPSVLMLAVATLGLPDALTYYIAKRPGITRPAVLWAFLLTATLGSLCLLAVYYTRPFLSSGDEGLGELILLATALTVPALLVGVLRGAATGRQMWFAVATERLINSSLRVLTFGALWLLGELTVFVAVLVSALIPLITGLAYWRLFLPVASPSGDSSSPIPLRNIVSFGSRAWLGSVASMLLARLAPLLMVPLSTVEDLGLYTVATTISDLPLVVALAVQGALYGVDSRSTDARRLTATTRTTLLIGVLGCTLIGITLPLWIGFLFGPEFAAATLPTVMLLVSALICIPGLMAASAVAAWGRPGLRSLGLVVTLVANAGSFVLLVPPFGVYGACWTSLISNVVLTSYMVSVACRLIKARPSDFLLPRPSDARVAVEEMGRLTRRLLPSRRRHDVRTTPTSKTAGRKRTE
ncbi:oligosaccharide flippase family protein [Blastococcus saxobsidens]|nr:oligosaccharide flippase family protein [Blastococcus saxobsidens]